MSKGNSKGSRECDRTSEIVVTQIKLDDPALGVHCHALQSPDLRLWIQPVLLSPPIGAPAAVVENRQDRSIVEHWSLIEENDRVSVDKTFEMKRKCEKLSIFCSDTPPQSTARRSTSHRPTSRRQREAPPPPSADPEYRAADPCMECPGPLRPSHTAVLFHHRVRRKDSASHFQARPSGRRTPALFEEQKYSSFYQSKFMRLPYVDDWTFL